jgi:hypothetical protein
MGSLEFIGRRSMTRRSSTGGGKASATGAPPHIWVSGGICAICAICGPFSS